MSTQLTPAQETAKALADECSVKYITIPSSPLPKLKGLKEEDYFKSVAKNGRNTAITSYYGITILAKVLKEYPDRLRDKKGLTLKQLSNAQKGLEAALGIKASIIWEPLEKGSVYISVNPGMAPVLSFTNGYVEGYFADLLQEPAAQKPPKFKRSGHLTDQLLKFNYPRDKSLQLNLFDTLQESTKDKITAVSIKREELVEGIKLSPSETKLIDCLCKLLHERSQTTNSAQEDYYTGNAGGGDLVHFGGEKTPAPRLAFTLYEIAQEYKGGERVAGKDIENVKQILTELDKKSFLMSYKETIHKHGGGRIENKIEEFSKLLRIVKISQAEYNQEDIELSKKEETIVALNPIFRRQIDTKFILYPTDIVRRTIIAYGSHNLSEAAIKLREYLMREHSAKRYEPEINLDKLYYLLAEKWMRESRKKKVKEYTDKALETVKNLGLVISYEQKPGATGEAKIVFKLDKDWG
jgi:hypothetical protein